MTSTARKLLVAALAVVVLAIGGFAVWQSTTTQTGDGGGSGTALVGGPFTLVDQNGKTVTDADFRGRLMLIYFGYSYCPDVCPTELHKMTVALDMLNDGLDEVAPIFITVDPERDTVEQMKAYATLFHPNLIALTGTQAQTDAAVQAYRVYYKKVRGEETALDYLVDHSSFIYLMGRDGAYLTHFDSASTPEEIAAAVRDHL